MIALIGAWLVIDGIGSIILYEKQSMIEHLLRIVRALSGAALALYSYLFL